MGGIPPVGSPDRKEVIVTGDISSLIAEPAEDGDAQSGPKLVVNEIFGPT
jgi:hypothetical protein